MKLTSSKLEEIMMAQNWTQETYKHDGTTEEMRQIAFPLQKSRSRLANCDSTLVRWVDHSRLPGPLQAALALPSSAGQREKIR